MPDAAEKLHPVREALQDENSDALFIEEADSALLGIARRRGKRPLAAYSYRKLILHFMKNGCETVDDAIDWIAYNVAGAWLGDMTPIIVDDLHGDI